MRWLVCRAQAAAICAPKCGRYFLRIIEQRRREPQADLISALLAAQVDGQQLSQQELLGFCILLLVAGNATTTQLIGNALLCFDEQPEVFEALRADPALIPGAIEEVLRYRSPVQMMFRHVVTDVELSGQQLHRGQWVLAQIGSANRDEDQFPDADHFDFKRAPNRHLAFGHGIHFCLGAPLARLEAKIALTLLLERFRGDSARAQCALRRNRKQHRIWREASTCHLSSQRALSSSRRGVTGSAVILAALPVTPLSCSWVNPRALCWA